jgi:hypothetical protein
MYDITYCVANCTNEECFRNKAHFPTDGRHVSQADFSLSCDIYQPYEDNNPYKELDFNED